MNTVNQLLSLAGRSEPVVISHGRDLADLEPSANGIMPLVEAMRVALLERGYLMLEFSQSRGLVGDLSTFPKADTDRINGVLALLAPRNAQGEQQTAEGERFHTVLQGLSDIARQGTVINLTGGRELRLFLLAHYAEHIAPDLDAGQMTLERVRIIEGLLDLSRRFSFIRSGHLVCLNESSPALIHRLLRQHFPVCNIAMPGVEDKRRFVEALNVRYPEARIAEALVPADVASLSAGTHNRGLHGLWKSSSEGTPITRSEIFQRRQEDVSAQSEGTLLALDAERNARIRLTGRMIRRPMEVLMNVAKGIRQNDPGTLRNLMLIGAPSGAKTQLAMHVAALSGVPSFELVLPKSQWVGESERRTRLQLQLLREQPNCLAILDEVEHLLPMDRSQHSGDSGVSQSLQGLYQTFLADASLSGRLALIGTSNRPFAISEAMRQRWVFLPVFSAIPEDVADILQAMLEQLGVNDTTPAALHNAAAEFHRRGASPREMREAVIAARSLAGQGMSTDAIVQLAARNMIGGTDHGSMLLGDLSALQFCRSNLYLPWHNGATGAFDTDFPIPAHIREFVDNRTGEVDTDRLNHRVNVLLQQVNI